MTSFFCHLRSVVFWFAVAGWIARAGAATLTVTPAITSNTYNGVITINIGGLTNGEKVLVEKYIDLNGNGAIDAGEPLVDMFEIADGGAMVIGGITNVTVPFDHNSATGAITTSLGLVGSLVFENMVGHYVYQVASPSGNFAPVTALFEITNAALAQSVSGI